MRGLLAAALLMLLGTGAAAEPIAAVNRDSFYPEGPLWTEGRLYYAEMAADRVMMWDGRENRIFWSGAGCGPTSIARYGDAEFAILCHLGAAVLRVDATGKRLARISGVAGGERLLAPNDSVSDGSGGVYFSDSGIFDKQAPRTGKIYHLASDGTLRKLADGLWYTNGVVLDARNRRLLVSEHLGRRVLAFPVRADFSLGAPETFLELDRVAPKAAIYYHQAGPDGLEIDAEGNIYVAEYGAGRIIVVNTRGRLLKTVEVGEKFVTNLALDERRDAYVTGSRSNTEPPFRGSVMKIRIW